MEYLTGKFKLALEAPNLSPFEDVRKFSMYFYFPLLFFGIVHSKFRRIYLLNRCCLPEVGLVFIDDSEIGAENVQQL